MDVQAIDQGVSAAGGQATTGQAAPVPGLPAFPQADGTKKPAQTDETLHRALSQLVGGGSHVTVQFRVVGPDEIVTVFKNKDTGEVITQFPSEAMVLIAQFFNQLAGTVLDRQA